MAEEVQHKQMQSQIVLFRNSLLRAQPQRAGGGAQHARGVWLPFPAFSLGIETPTTNSSTPGEVGNVTGHWTLHE